MLSLKPLWINFLARLEKAARNMMLLFVGFYRSIGTTYLGGSCRFTPSCSEYAVECLHSHKPHSAFYLITKRILRCRPGGDFGYDPVPISKLPKN